MFIIILLFLAYMLSMNYLMGNICVVLFVQSFCNVFASYTYNLLKPKSALFTITKQKSLCIYCSRTYLYKSGPEFFFVRCSGNFLRKISRSRSSENCVDLLIKKLFLTLAEIHRGAYLQCFKKGCVKSLFLLIKQTSLKN